MTSACSSLPSGSFDPLRTFKTLLLAALVVAGNLSSAASQEPATKHATLTTPKGIVERLIFSADGKQLYGVMGENTDTRTEGPGWVWDLATQKTVANFGSPGTIVADMAAKPNAPQRVYVVTYNGKVQEWDLGPAKPALAAEGKEQTASLEGMALAITPDGQTLLVGGTDDLEFWATETLGATGRKLDDIRFGAIAVSKDGKHFVTADGNNQVRVWEVESGKEVAKYEFERGSNAVAAFDPAGRLIAFQQKPDGSDSSAVVVLDALTGKVEKRLSLETPGSFSTGNVMSVAFSPNGKLLAAGDVRGDVHLWDLASGKPIALFQDHKSPEGANGTRAEDLMDLVEAVAFSPDSERLATGAGDGSIHIYAIGGGSSTADVAGTGTESPSSAEGGDASQTAKGTGRRYPARKWTAANGSSSIVA